MVTIGGKTKIKKPIKPQIVIKRGFGLNEYAIIGMEDNMTTLSWIGDPNAATKFDSKYGAKSRIRDIEDIPENREFVTLQNLKGKGR